jgi:hypothetical protein
MACFAGVNGIFKFESMIITWYNEPLGSLILP